MKFSAIITAGGTSSRFGNTNKLLEQINGKEIIKYTIDAFLEAVDVHSQNMRLFDDPEKVRATLVGSNEMLETEILEVGDGLAITRVKK